MENLQLPPELERLEHRLTCGPRPEPSASLRRRVLSGVGAELRSKQVAPKWRLAAAFAVIFLVELSVSFGILQTAAMAIQPPLTLDEVAQRLRQISPGLSQEDSLRQAAVRQIGVEASRSTLLGDLSTKCACP